MCMEVVSTSFTIMTSIVNSIVIVPAFGSIADAIEDKYELYQDACSLRDTPFYSLQDTDINAFTNPLSFQLDAIKIQLLNFGYDKFQINSFIDRFEVSIKHIVELLLDDNNILNEVIRKPDMFRGYIFAKSALIREKYPLREQQCFDILIRCVADEYVVLAPKSPDFDVIALEGTIIALAQIFYEQGAKDQARVLGEDHPDTLTTRNQLTNIYRVAGRLDDEAITLYENLVADRIRVLGEDHSQTLWTRCNLAGAYKDAGRIDEAITLYENLVLDCIRVLGEDHPQTLWTRCDLAEAYKDAGRLDEAIALHEQLLPDRIRVLGEDHPDTLITRNQLANVYRFAGRLDEAITLYENLLSDRIRVLGEDHPQTLWTRCDLAEAYKDAGRLDEAITLSVQEPGA